MMPGFALFGSLYLLAFVIVGALAYRAYTRSNSGKG